MPYTVVGTEYVEINGVPLDTTGWRTNNLAPLWDAAQQRGDDRLVPYLDGLTPERRRVDVMRVPIPVTVFGDYNWNNTAYSNKRIGLQTNMDHLRANLLLPSTSDDDPTLDLILHMPDGSTRGGGCFVLPSVNPQSLGPGVLQITLDVLLPSGNLMVLTS